MQTESTSMQTVITQLADCHGVAKPQQPFLMILRRGEVLVQTVLSYMNALNIDGASLSGLGTAENPCLAYYDHEEKTYHTKTFDGLFEVLSLNGNITWNDGERFMHVHACLSGHDYHAFGGHVMDFTVGATLELSVTPLNCHPTREMDETIGLCLIREGRA